MTHSQDLHHTDEDVDKVELKADALVDNILSDDSSLGQPGVVQDLLDIVESEATEDGKATVQPDALRPHQSTSSGDGEDHRSQTGKSDNGDSSEKRATEVHVAFLLGGGTHESNRAHHSDSIETSTSEDSRVEEHHRGKKGGLSEVECGPHAVLDDVAEICQYSPLSGILKANLLLRRRIESSKHGSDASNQADTEDKPRVRRHQAIRPAVHVQSSSGNTDDTNTKTSVQESVVQVAALKWRHATVLSRFAVEDHVRNQNRSSDDGSAIQQTLGEVATLSGLVGRLHVRPSEGILESLSRLGQDGGGTSRMRLRGLERRIVDESSGIRRLRHLAKRRGDGKRAPEEKRHDFNSFHNR